MIVALVSTTLRVDCLRVGAGDKLYHLRHDGNECCAEQGHPNRLSRGDRAGEQR